jgi:hypothetical protein
MEDHEEAERTVKPRKLFEVKMVVWDDGIVSTDYTEIEKTDRGTKKWTHTKEEFSRAVECLLGEGIEKVLKTQVDFPNLLPEGKSE